MRIVNIFLSLILACPMAMYAQSLSKEITIEKEIVPQQQNVSRIEVAPNRLSSGMQKHTLSYGNCNVMPQLRQDIALLEPAAYADSLYGAEYRGYAALGFLPIYNTALSAGYSIVDNNRTRLGAWLQYDGKVYDGTTRDDDEITMREHTLSLGVSGTCKFSGHSVLSAHLDYTLSRYKVPYGNMEGWTGYYQTVNDVKFDVDWLSKAGEMDYAVNMAFGHFAYAQDAVVSDKYAPVNVGTLSPVRENRLLLGGKVSASVNDDDRLGVDLDTKFMNYNNSSLMLRVSSDAASEYVYVLSRPEEQMDYGIVTLTPHYDCQYDAFKMRIGAKFDIGINSGNALHVAPDVKVDWTPTQLFAAYAHFSGGEYVNSLASLWLYDRYTAPMIAYETSSVPFVVDAGVVIGQWRGASFGIFGSYAVANDWLMPNYAMGTDFFSVVDMKGWRIGAEIAYDYRDIVSFKASYETAPQKHNRGYYLWRDRARHSVNASLKVSPISALDITAQFRLRADRCVIDRFEAFDGWGKSPFVTSSIYDLGNICNLSIGAAYRLTDELSLFGRVENILNKKCFVNVNVPAQGATGLLGATCKF